MSCPRCHPTPRTRWLRWLPLVAIVAWGVVACLEEGPKSPKAEDASPQVEEPDGAHFDPGPTPPTPSGGSGSGSGSGGR